MLPPGDAGYDKSRKVHNGLIDKHPALIARLHLLAYILKRAMKVLESSHLMKVIVNWTDKLAPATNSDFRWHSEPIAHGASPQPLPVGELGEGPLLLTTTGVSNTF